VTCRGSHWFAYYGMPGSSSPTCVRPLCEIPNPDYDRERDPFARQTEELDQDEAVVNTAAGLLRELEDLRTTVRVLSELVRAEFNEPIPEVAFYHINPTPTDDELAAVARATGSPLPEWLARST
jgi:hypothetical protein